MCIKSDAKNRQQHQKWLFSEANRDDTDAESPFPLFFSFPASFRNSSLREKVAKRSSYWDRWAESLFVSIIVAKYNIFPLANNCRSRKEKKILANRFAHAMVTLSASTIEILSTLTYTEFDCVALLAMLYNKWRSLSRVLHCDKTRWSFENTREL